MKPAFYSRSLLLCALLCFGALGIALVSQHVFGMMPCAWCVLQRLTLVVTGVFCLIGAASPGLRRLMAAMAGITAIMGLIAAGYQYFVAAQLVSCDRTFADRFMVQSGLDGTLPSIFGIFATCMDARVNLLGIEYAVWAMGVFALLTIATLYVAIRLSGRPGQTPY